MENFFLRESLVDKNGWQHYVYQADECALHGTYVRATGIEYQPLKEKFSSSQSIDRYNADPGGQATFNSGHKITVLI